MNDNLPYEESDFIGVWYKVLVLALELTEGGCVGLMIWYEIKSF